MNSTKQVNNYFLYILFYLTIHFSFKMHRKGDQTLQTGLLMTSCAFVLHAGKSAGLENQPAAKG